MADNKETEADPKPEAPPEPIKLDPVFYDTVLGSGAPAKDDDE